MDRYYIAYKDRILAGPLPKEDAEQKLVKMLNWFQNVQVVPETKVKKKKEA